MWASGEMRCGSYNHYYTPNAPIYDCVTNDLTTYTSMAFRAARAAVTRRRQCAVRRWRRAFRQLRASPCQPGAPWPRCANGDIPGNDY